jgi:hypothetical protein
MKTKHGRSTQEAAAPIKKTTTFEEQVAKDWRRFKEKYFACTEYPAVRRALKKILVAEEKEMTDACVRPAASIRSST